MSKYIPEVDHYVKWNSCRGIVEGWVYFKDTAYITIETKVFPKPPEDLPHGTHHRNERTLVICYPENWNELEYIKSRSSKYSDVYDEK